MKFHNPPRKEKIYQADQLSVGPYPRRLTHYLAEKGIGGIDLTEVEFPHVAANWPEGFLRDLSPGGTLPILQTDEGVTIGQSIAILEYLEEKYPTPNLAGFVG